MMQQRPKLILDFMNHVTDLNSPGGAFADMTPPEIVFALQALIHMHNVGFVKVVEEGYPNFILRPRPHNDL